MELLISWFRSQCTVASLCEGQCCPKILVSLVLPLC